MKKKHFKLDNIPAILWGEDSETLYIAVHGNLSSKEDTPIQIFAEEAVKKGYQVLSFDFPEHGERKEEKTPCKVQNCVNELNIIYKFAENKANEIGLFANSIGVYFSLLAYKDFNLKQSLFLSPLIDMNKIINDMMIWFDISEEKLKEEKEIITPIGQTLYWDYYQYVKEHPIVKWETKTSILYGTLDGITSIDMLSLFCKNFNCDLDIVNGANHYFQNYMELNYLRKWIVNKLA